MEKWWLQLLREGEGAGTGGTGAPAGGAPPASGEPTAADLNGPPGDDIFAEFDRVTKGLEPLETGHEPATAAPKGQETPPKPGEAPKPAAAGQEPQAPPKLKTPPPPQPAPAPAGQAGAPDPTTSALMAQVAALQQQIATMQAQTAQTAQQAPTGQPQAQAPAQQRQPLYDLRVPPKLVEALRDQDNPANAQQALEHFANGIAEVVHATVEQSVAARYQREWAPALVGHIQQQQGAVLNAQAYQGDFYGTHSDLNHPALKPIVQQVASAYFRELPTGFQYTPQVRDEIANRVRLMIHGFAGGAPPGAGGQAGANPRPATYSGSGARPAGIQPNGQPLGFNTPDGITNFIRSVSR